MCHAEGASSEPCAAEVRHADGARAAKAAPGKAHSPAACRKAAVPAKAAAAKAMAAKAMAAKAAAASAPAAATASAGVGFEREKRNGEEQRGDASGHHHDRPHGISARIKTLSDMDIFLGFLSRLACNSQLIMVF